MKIDDEIALARLENRFEEIIEKIPYAKLIGIECYPIGAIHFYRHCTAV